MYKTLGKGYAMQHVSIFYLIFQFEETNQLKQLQDNKVLPPISNEKFQKYGIAKKDEAHFERMFRKILKVRIPGTDGSRQVRQVKKSICFMGNC